MIPMLLTAQVQNPLIPSKRNDRLLQEQAEQQAHQAELQNNNATDSTKLATDSAIMAPTRVKQLGANNYEQLTLPTSSMDLNNPSNVNTTVEYDPATGGYVMHTRIGETDITTPYFMTADEYQAYSEQQLMQKYWQQKIGEVEHNNERKFDITDMKFDIGPADKVFGPGGVQLKMQGSAELLFGFKHQYIGNPALTQRARNNNIFDFDEKIQASVTGKVGDKLDFKLNYNTEASFSFDQQNLKLAYKGKEDDIIQSVEMGNVTMDLNSSLIQGAQALFGAKTKLKFGKLSIQAVISQQNSESQTVSSEGGAQTTPYEINIDNYDENRHFFLGYYFRDHYEQAMTSLPYIASGVTINRIEVWVTNKRGNYDNARNLVALVDLGESESHILDSRDWHQSERGDLPRNKTNTIYETLKTIDGIRDIRQVSSILQGYDQMQGGEDYEKIESARLLNSSEYTLNSALGYISLKSALQQDEVLAVAYEYTYGGQVYQVGEFSTDGGESLRAPNALIVKLLKTTATAPSRMKGTGAWDLMMKNIYAIGASNLGSEKFELNILYRNDSVGTSITYLNEGDCQGKPLLRVLGLDRLDSRNNKFSDGKFDFVQGYTVQTNNGRIIFPVLEPFGSALRQAIGDPKIADKYCFQELYDSTLVIAQEMTEKNKFTLKGRFAGSSGNEINLNAMNIPRGSVVVTAGGATLIENVDYTVDYTMGKVTILNESIMESGTAVNVKLENQSTFSMTRKGLYGLHLDYEFNKDFIVGGTLMHMREQALTTKVNQGNEPKANTIWGVNFAYKTDLPWLTSALDQIPWINAKAPSSFQLNGEFAQLIPGHTRDVGKSGTSYIDDFESTKTAIDVHYPSYWFLSSTPSRYEEYKNSNDISYGKNRALLAWYYVDPIFGYPQSNTPGHLRNDADALSDHRTRIVYEQELYPNKEQLASEDTRLSVLNLSFYPEERGPYNIDATQIGADGKLTNPRQRWGGMMRRLDNTDFEKANVEYIEFWLMDPALTNPDDPNYDATLYINLGDISEDILRDGKKSFENGLPTNDADTTLTEKTIWGRVPRTNSTVTAFSNEPGARIHQDVGLNGLNDEQEYAFEYNGRRPYKEYVDAVLARVNDSVKLAWNNPTERFSPIQDPAGDNFHYYRGSDYDAEARSVLYRYKHYNGTQGNSPDTDTQTESYGTASTLNPDVEDINRDNTLSEYEKYYEYKVRLNKNDLRAGNQYITEVLHTDVTLRNGEKTTVTWYQFKIPIKGGASDTVGTIRNLKSVRFMRMYLTNCEREFHMRMGTLDLVRGEWRQYNKQLCDNKYLGTVNTGALLDVQAVNIEENSARHPVNYVLPPGVSRQTDPGQAQLIAQNEQAMVLRVHNLSPKDARAVYKGTSFDMRNYKRLQMFVHAERMEEADANLQDGDLSCYIRMGSDLTSNYYEYEIPLSLTPEGLYNNNNEQDRLKVWPESNYFDFPFTALTNAKTERNRAKRAGNTNVGNTIRYVIYDDANGNPQNRITVLGNPTLEDIEYIMIGVRNNGSHEASGEVWVNELRLNQFNEQGGVAAMANASLAISDIAQVNFSGRIETAGYGSIESNVMSRNMEDRYQLAVSAALEAGRLFPEKAKLQIPLYVSYQNETTSPLYDPLDSDTKLKDNLETFEEKIERDSVKAMSRTVQESTSFSVTNLKVNIHSKKRDMFYDPANFSVSAAFNRQSQHSPEIERDETTDHRGSFQYSYSFNPQPWEPFKNVKSVQKVKFLKEMNFYYLPQSWSFNTNMHRMFSQTLQRDLTNTAGSRSDLLTYSKDFTWDRNFDFKYDLTKNMKFSFQTAMNSTVDEGKYAREVIPQFEEEFITDRYQAWKDTIQRSLAKWGSPYTYQQVFTASWNLPLNRIPYLEAITANASYNANYNWARTQNASNEDQEHSLGNTISSVQSWQVDGGINFETLYGKSNYWKTMTQRYTGRQRQRPFKAKNYSETVNAKKGEPISITHRLDSTTLNVTATDSTGRKIAVSFKPDGNNKITVTPREDCAALTVAVATKDPNERTPAQVTGDMFAYVGTMVRRLQVTYRRTNSMTVPGFNRQAGFMGQNYEDGAAPGFDFAFGFIPNNWIERAKERNWLSGDTAVVQPATRARTEDLDIKLTLEPLPGLKIQVNGKRYFANSTSIIYTYDHLQENMTGSFNITQVAIGTAFQRIGGIDDNFASATFSQFLENRDIMQGRVQERYDHINYPDYGFTSGHIYAGKAYDRSLGRVEKNSGDVLVPAFLSAYTGRDVTRMSFDPFLSVLKMLPNWSVTYDGLGKLPWMKDHFRSVTLTHAYTCKYSIGSYNSYSTWIGANGNDKTLGFVRDVTTDNPLPSSAYDITNVSLSETFSPLIGLNMTMKNSLSVKGEYRKQRNLALNVTSVQITEGHTDEFVIGAGYTIKNLNFNIKGKDSAPKKVSNDLKLNVDLSYKNIKTLLRKVEEDITQASNGNKVFSIKIAADYVLSSKVNLQLYYDHQTTTPLISTSYPTKADNIGLNIKLMLTR